MNFIDADAGQYSGDGRIGPPGPRKLLDFGLAKETPSSLASRDGKEVDATRTITTTDPGTIVGTIAYMNPEQARGEAVDARSDQFSFGLILYEMAAGKRAFQRASAAETMTAIIREDAEPLPASGRGGSWRPLTVPGRIVPRPWRGRAPAAGDLVSFGIYPPEKAVFSNQLNTTVNAPQFALSPDGRTIVFAAVTGGDKPLLWRRSLGEVTAQPLAGTDNAQDPFWSADSRWIGFDAEGTLKRISATGGSVQVVCRTVDFRGGTWGPDDTILFATMRPHTPRCRPGGSPVPASI